MTSSRRLTLRLLALGTVVAFLLAGCGGDDDKDSSDKKSSTTEKADTTEKDDKTTTTAASGEDPIKALIEQRLEQRGVDEVRIEGQVPVLVMKDGASLADVSSACELAKTIVPGGKVQVERDGSVDDCP